MRAILETKVHLPIVKFSFCRHRCQSLLVLRRANVINGAPIIRRYYRGVALMGWRTIKETADVISGILNWVCPECAGRMGGRGRESKCQGECQMDWRPIWEGVLSPKTHSEEDQPRLNFGRRTRAAVVSNSCAKYQIASSSRWAHRETRFN
jgi:hypothetical protein